jgi:hypothetical protein
LQPLLKEVEYVLAAKNPALDPAIRTIPHPASQFQRGRLPTSRLAESDALHTACDNESV